MFPGIWLCSKELASSVIDALINAMYRLETPSVLETLEPAAKAVRKDIQRRMERTKSV